MSPLVSLLCVFALSPVAEEKEFSSQLERKIKEVLVKPGDVVKKGQVLVRLDDTVALKEVAARGRGIERAENDLENRIDNAIAESLWNGHFHLLGPMFGSVEKPKSVSQQEWDISRFRTQMMWLELKVAKLDLETTKADL